MRVHLALLELKAEVGAAPALPPIQQENNDHRRDRAHRRRIYLIRSYRERGTKTYGLGNTSIHVWISSSHAT